MKLYKRLARRVKEIFSIKDETIDEDIRVDKKPVIEGLKIGDTKEGGTKVFKALKEDNEKVRTGDTIKISDISLSQSYLKLVEGGNEVKSFEIDSVETNIGRERSNEVVVFDQNVSRVHAQIINEGYYYSVVDLNSTNGVVVNGEFVQEKRLFDQDKIILGETEFIFSLKG